MRSRLIAAGVAAAGLVLAAGTMTALSATAAPARVLSLSPGATSVGILDLDRSATAANAASAYCVQPGRLATTSRVQLVSGPEYGVLQFDRAPAGATPTVLGQSIAVGTDSPATDPTAFTAPIPAGSHGDEVCFGADNAPGTYVVRIFTDANGDKQYESADEAATPAVTFTVLDVNNVVAGVRNWAPVIKYLPAAPKYGSYPKVTVNDANLTSVDFRGFDSAGRPILGWNAVGQHLTWFVNGGGYATTPTAHHHVTTPQAITGFSQGLWYRVGPRAFRDIDLSDSVSEQVKLATTLWYSPKVTFTLS